jgi:1-acyl-sn-glycerol-3-phosphate acyltransferase
MLAHASAAVLFLALAAAPIAGATVWLAKSGMNPLQGFLWLLALLLAKLRWRVRWEGELPLVDGQGAVLVCNHRSSVDPFFVQTATRRKTHWLVAREYCEHPAFGWFLRACEVIPVGRGGVDTAATKAALRIVKEGGIVGMFPEGRINMTRELLLPCRPGAALVAIKAEVPLLPVYISGSPYDRFPWSPFFLRAKVTVRFGEPIVALPDVVGKDDTTAAKEILLTCLTQIARLARQPGFRPTLAGRSWKPTAEELASAQEASRQEKLLRTE